MFKQIASSIMQISLALGISILVYSLIIISAGLIFDTNNIQKLLNKIKLNQETQMIAYLLIMISTIGIILSKVLT